MANSGWIGKTLGGRYKIEELLGQGGMSAVYKATDPNLRRVVAVKIIHSHLSNDPGFVRRFEEEAASVAQLRHPNIVQIYDFNSEGDSSYMVMEFVPGETLQDHLRRLNTIGRHLLLNDVIRYSTGICDAVDYAHQRGLIHRDIKPANIMLSVMGQAILMDFGIAKILGGQQHTATGAVIGTALYMSPEQIKGETADRRTDIYSLGVTLFEMIGGRPPFEADSAMTLMMMHINDPVPDLRQLNPEVPADLAQVINKSLEKNPNDRYQTAAEIALALRKIQERIATGQPLETIAQEATRIESSKDTSLGATVFETPETDPVLPGGTLIEPVPIPREPPTIQEKKRVETRSEVHPVGRLTSSQSGAAVYQLKKRNNRSIFIIGGSIALIALLCLVGGGAFAYNRFIAGAGGAGNANTETTGTPPTGISALLPVVTEEESMETPPAEIPSPTPTQVPSTPTLEPSLTPTVTLRPTATVPAGIPFARINSIAIEGNDYVVDYETFEFTEKISSTDLHVHFFFDTVPPEQAGHPGSGPWILYGGPRPFKGYSVADRPASATQMCILVSNPDHSVQADTGTCMDLPDATAESPAETTTAGEGSSDQTPITLTDESGVEMILIPSGSFEMGSTSGAPDEAPVHTVVLEDYYIDKYEVTNANYEKCVEAGSCNPPSESKSNTREIYFGNPEFENYPVIFVTWYDGEDYCNWRGARLPTEAEWEKAGRAPDNRNYPWGEETQISCDYTNYNNCTADTAAVGSSTYDVSPYGVYDLAGNVREWIEDYLRPYPGGDPNGSPEYGKGHRVVRGGGHDSNEDQIRLSNRASYFPDDANFRKGFRCARTP